MSPLWYSVEGLENIIYLVSSNLQLPAICGNSNKLLEIKIISEAEARVGKFTNCSKAWMDGARIYLHYAGLLKAKEFLKRGIERVNSRDVVACAKTGSGKTLAFFIPAIELIHKVKFRVFQGTGVIILSPTRELVKQTYDAVKKLMKYHWQTHALLVGKGDYQKEKDKLQRGANLVVATPGRLLHHMQKTECFVIKHFAFLMIDEADRMLDFGFEEEMKAILKIITKFRMNALFSAMLAQKAMGLAKLAVREEAIHIGLEPDIPSTVEGLK